MPKIEILSGKREGEIVDLPADGIDIGNRKTAKLSIRDPWISWNHAKIVPEEGRFVIEDLGSSNGTWINGKKVTRQALGPEEVIFLGKTKIRFVEVATAAATEQLAAAPGAVEENATTLKLSRDSLAPTTIERTAALERENAELKKMKAVLERFLDLTPDERQALANTAAPAAPVAAADTGAAEKARQEAVARLIELEGRLAAAESRAVELENRIKGSSDQAKKDLQRAREKFDEELGFARAAKIEAEAAKDRAEEKVRDLSKKVDVAAQDANARADRLEKELETARKSAIDAEARASKLERDLDQARRVGGGSGSAAASSAELDKVKADLTHAIAERDEWKRKHDQVRAEIDQISMDQIEIEDELRGKIAELEAKLQGR